MINVIITDSNIKPIMGFAKENNLLMKNDDNTIIDTFTKLLDIKIVDNK